MTLTVEIPNQYTGSMRKFLVIFSVFSVIGMGLGFACGNYVFMSRKIITSKLHQRADWMES